MMVELQGVVQMVLAVRCYDMIAGLGGVGVNKKATYTIVESANDAFGLAILGGCVRAC